MECTRCKSPEALLSEEITKRPFCSYKCQEAHYLQSGIFDIVATRKHNIPRDIVYDLVRRVATTNGVYQASNLAKILAFNIKLMYDERFASDHIAQVYDWFFDSKYASDIAVVFEIDQTALIQHVASYAANVGFKRVYIEMLRHGAQILESHLIGFASLDFQGDIIRFILPRIGLLRNPREAFVNAISAGNREAVFLLLNHAPYSKEVYQTAAITAIKHHNFEIYRMFVPSKTFPTGKDLYHASSPIQMNFLLFMYKELMIPFEGDALLTFLTNCTFDQFEQLGLPKDGDALQGAAYGLNIPLLVYLFPFYTQEQVRVYALSVLLEFLTWKEDYAKGIMVVLESFPKLYETLPASLRDRFKSGQESQSKKARV